MDGWGRSIIHSQLWCLWWLCSLVVLSKILILVVTRMTSLVSAGRALGRNRYPPKCFVCLPVNSDEKNTRKKFSFMTTTTWPFPWMDEEGLYYTRQWLCTLVVQSKIGRLGVVSMTMHAWESSLVKNCHIFKLFRYYYITFIHGWMRKVYTIHPMAMYIGCTVKNIDLGCQQHDSACMWLQKSSFPKIR